MPNTSNFSWTIRSQLCVVLWPNWREQCNRNLCITTSPDGTQKDKRKPVNEATAKNFEKDNKIVRGHLLNHITNPCLICLSHSNMPRSYGRNQRSNTELMMLERRSTWLVNGYGSKSQMKNQSWSKFIFLRTCVVKFWMKTRWRARLCRLVCWSRNSHHPRVITGSSWNIKIKFSPSRNWSAT